MTDSDPAGAAALAAGFGCDCNATIGNETLALVLAPLSDTTAATTTVAAASLVPSMGKSDF